nr:50S ribosomal protein L10 [Bacteroidota bacterium]
MTREEKNQAIDSMVETLSSYNGFYITDISGLDSKKTTKLRKMCHERGVKLSVAKNTIIRKALEKMNAAEYEPIFDVLKGSSALMLCETANLPAKMIKEIRSVKDNTKPILKCAYIEYSIFKGDDQIAVLASLKSKNELIADLVSILQSPMRNVLGALQSGGNTISGIIKTLESR